MLPSLAPQEIVEEVRCRFGAFIQETGDVVALLVERDDPGVEITPFQAMGLPLRDPSSPV
jgi:hypothetical protein